MEANLHCCKNKWTKYTNFIPWVYPVRILQKPLGVLK